MSFPLWERGLKYPPMLDNNDPVIVVPLVGTWIEIAIICILKPHTGVVPLVGTWIEIVLPSLISSIPAVVPLVGTWIEILPDRSPSQRRICRSPCGNVD